MKEKKNEIRTLRWFCLGHFARFLILSFIMLKNGHTCFKNYERNYQEELFSETRLDWLIVY